ncbi:MAG: hypothetical protein PF518_03465, partial [Spirochaetaceae bacterium]|nr:hypothetical protein [Spirochaetaceae bacterium]
MTFKRFGKKVLQIFLIIFIVLFLIGLSLFIHHQITKESVENYLPTGAQAYIEIESFRDFYN